MGAVHPEVLKSMLEWLGKFGNGGIRGSHVGTLPNSISFYSTGKNPVDFSYRLTDTGDTGMEIGKPTENWLIL